MFLVFLSFMALAPYLQASTDFSMSLSVPTTENLGSSVEFTCSWDPVDVEYSDVTVIWEIQSASVQEVLPVKVRRKSEWPNGMFIATAFYTDPDQGDVMLNSERRVSTLTLRRLSSQADGRYSCVIRSVKRGFTGEQAGSQLVSRTKTIAFRAVVNQDRANISNYQVGGGFIRSDPALCNCTLDQYGREGKNLVPYFENRIMGYDKADSLASAKSVTQATTTKKPCPAGRTCILGVVYYASYEQWVRDLDQAANLLPRIGRTL